MILAVIATQTATVPYYLLLTGYVWAGILRGFTHLSSAATDSSWTAAL